MGKNSKKKNTPKPAVPEPQQQQQQQQEAPVETPSTPAPPVENEYEALKNANTQLQEQNDKAKKIVKAQKEKCKKIEDELEASKRANDEWEAVTQRLHAEVDALKEKEQNLLSQQNGAHDAKELTEKLNDKTNELTLIREQLEAREGQLTQLQTRLSELEHENEMMSDRDDQIITLRDELQARHDQLEALREALTRKTEETGKLDEELNFLRPKFSSLEELNESLTEQIDEMNSQLGQLKGNVREDTQKMEELTTERDQLRDTLVKREDQLQNLQAQLASGTEAENRLGELEKENASLSEKLTIMDEQMVEAIQAKDTQLQAMKESLAHFERMKLQQAETEEKYLQKTASEEELKQKLAQLQTDLDAAAAASTQASNDKILELTKKLKAYSKARKDLIAENDELKKQKDQMISQMADKQSALMNEKANDDERLTMLTQERNTLLQQLETITTDKAQADQTVDQLRDTLQQRETAETELAAKLATMSESIGTETEKAKKYKALAEKFKKISTELKKRNESLTDDGKLKDQMNELVERETSMKASFELLNKENETLRVSIESAEQERQATKAELDSIRNSHGAKLGENEVLKAEIEQLRTNIEGQSNRLQQCRDDYEHEITQLKVKNNSLEDGTKSIVLDLQKQLKSAAAELDEAVKSRDYLRSYLDQLEAKEKVETEKFERSRRQSVGIITTLEQRVKTSDQQVADFIERTASLENTIERLQVELRTVETRHMTSSAKSVDSDEVTRLTESFNKQASVSTQLQEQLNEKQLHLEGLQKNNAQQRETIDDLENDCAILKEAIQLQKNDASRADKKIAKLQGQIAEMRSSGTDEDHTDRIIELTEKLTRAEEQLKIAEQQQSSGGDQEAFDKLKKDSDQRAKKLKAALISRKELLAGEKILKEQIEEMRKDLEEKRKLIQQKDETERSLTDKIDVLNETLTKMDDRSAVSKENREKSTEDFINQISSLKKLLSEARIDTQAVQRQLDQAEANKLALEGEVTNLTSENEILDNSQKNLTDMVKRLETEKQSLEARLSELTEKERSVSNQVETLEQEIESLQEQLDTAQQASSNNADLERAQHESSTKLETIQAELISLNNENAKLTETKLAVIMERDEAQKKLKALEEESKGLTVELREISDKCVDLNQSLVKAGAALDEAVNEKEAAEADFNKRLNDLEQQFESERSQWTSEKNAVKQQKELLQQSSEAAMSKLQGERDTSSSIRDELIEQKSLTEKFKFECESWKTKFQDQFGDKNSLEKQVISLKQQSTKLRDDLDQIETEKEMWRTKYDELTRGATALAEDKEAEVERLKLKYAELKQSLDYVEKEREIDLKEREAIVYRAESLQREFDHVNKLLQSEKRRCQDQEKELCALRLEHQNSTKEMECRHRDEKQKLEERILDFQSKNPEDLESQLQERQNMLDVYQNETNEKLTNLEKELTTAEEKISALEAAKSELEEAKSTLTDELSQLADENSEIKQIMSDAEQQVTEDKETVTSKINDLQSEIDQLKNTCQKQLNQIETLQELNNHLKQEKETLVIELKQSENNIHDLRQSFIEKETTTDVKQTALQNEIMSENKNFREQIKSLNYDLDLERKNINLEVEKAQSLEAQLHRVKTDLALSKDSVDLLKSEIKSFDFKLKSQKEEVLNNSRNQLQDKLREQMSKMQERLNVTELETSSSSHQLTSAQNENKTLVKDYEELQASSKVMSAENERLKAELEQKMLENERIQETMASEEPGTKSESLDVADYHDGQTVNYELFTALENELAVLRERNTILEEKFKVNRRISPRKQVKVTGKAIEPPPMAPPETYVSSADHLEISEAQLKLLRTELRQREELVSRLIVDSEHHQQLLKSEKNRNSQLKNEFESLAASVSAKETLIKDYETNDARMKKMVLKFQHQIEGTYDGDEDLKEMIKTKITEFDSLKGDIDTKVTHIKKLRKKLRKTRLRVRSCDAIEQHEEYDEDNNEPHHPDETKSEPGPMDENVVASSTTTDAELNPDDYVSCSVQ